MPRAIGLKAPGTGGSRQPRGGGPAHARRTGTPPAPWKRAGRAATGSSRGRGTLRPRQVATAPQTISRDRTRRSLASPDCNEERLHVP
jgi:hypothetical protein